MIYLFLGIGIAITISFSFFFSLSETALLSMNRYRIRFLLETKGRRAEYLSHILEHPERILSPILLGNTLCNTATATLTSYLIATLITREILRVSNGLAQAAASVLIAVLILVFSEITPKSIAARNPETFALRVIYPLRVVTWLLGPLVKLSLLASRGLIRLVTGQSPEPGVHRLSIEELKSILTHYSDDTLSAEAREMIHKLFEFPSIPVRDIMLPRNRVRIVECGASLTDATAMFLDNEFSSLPVYEGSPDNIVGVVRIRDCFRRLTLDDPAARSVPLRELMVPPTFVPETASIADILRQFQASANHFGMVVDEFGQFEGIITMEDVLEEIVGEIQAQNEQGKPSIRRIGPGNYVMDGILSVRDFNRFFPYPLPPNDAYATLAGFLMSKLGKLPAAREEMAWERYRFTVEEASGHQIRRVRLTILPAPAPPDVRPPDVRPAGTD
jgi:putative hemolysin